MLRAARPAAFCDRLKAPANSAAVSEDAPARQFVLSPKRNSVAKSMVSRKKSSCSSIVVEPSRGID